MLIQSNKKSYYIPLSIGMLLGISQEDNHLNLLLGYMLPQSIDCYATVTMMDITYKAYVRGVGNIVEIRLLDRSLN